MDRVRLGRARRPPVERNGRPGIELGATGEEIRRHVLAHTGETSGPVEHADLVVVAPADDIGARFDQQADGVKVRSIGRKMQGIVVVAVVADANVGAAVEQLLHVSATIAPAAICSAVRPQELPPRASIKSRCSASNRPSSSARPFSASGERLRGTARGCGKALAPLRRNKLQRHPWRSRRRETERHGGGPGKAVAAEAFAGRRVKIFGKAAAQDEGAGVVADARGERALAAAGEAL